MASKRKPATTKRKPARKPAKRSASINRKPRPGGDEPEELRLWRQIIAYRDVLEKSAAGWAKFLADERRGHACLLEDLPEAMREERRELWKEDSVAERFAAVALDRLHAFHDRLHSFKGTSGDYTIVRLRAAAELFGRDLLSEAVARVKDYCSNPDELARAYALGAIIAARDSTPRAIDDREVERILRPHDFGEGGHAPEPDLDALIEDGKARRTLNDSSHDAIAQYVVTTLLGLPPFSRKLRRRS